MWLGYAGLFAGVALAVLAIVTTLAKADGLRSTLALAAREATPWSTTDIDAVPSAGRVQRVAGIGVSLAEVSEFSMLNPLSALVPNSDAPARLGGVLLDVHVLRPLGLALDRQARAKLAPADDPRVWIGDAQQVDEWIAAWEGLADDPEEVDFRRLLSDAFGGGPDAWPSGLNAALAATSLRLPGPERGGMDVDGLADLARRNFITTMQRWADSVYANGPVATAARRAADRSAGWRSQHEALSALRTALQDPGQAWITAAEDTPDHRYEMRVLGRALTLSLVGQTTALSAKAAVSEIRIDAREMAEHFILPGVGPLLVRSSSGAPGGGGGPSLAVAPGAQAWSAFLDRLANAGFADLPTASRTAIAGPVTIDPATVRGMISKLHTFDRLATDLPGDLPPAVARDLLEQVVSELVAGVAASAELALRPAVRPVVGGDRAARVARVAGALDDLAEVVAWLRDHEAETEADRVLAVRSSVALNMLMAGTEVLVAEDPLAMYLDPAADANALVRRFGRGVERLRRVYERYGAPYADAATLGGAAVAYRWRDIGEDIARYDRGDADAALSGFEGLLRAYAVDQDAACAAPRPALASGRDDYVARALDRFRTQVDGACAGLDAHRSARLYARLEEYFGRDVAWMWPYASDASAPEMPSATLGEFVARLVEARDVLDGFHTPLARVFRESADFWDRDMDGSAVLRFRMDWRTRPEEEELAEHIIAFEIEGAERDEDGVYTWRYGTPAALRVRLAKNSPYRFAYPADPEGRVFVVGGGLPGERLATDTGSRDRGLRGRSRASNGSLLRVFNGLANGAFAVRTEVVDADGVRHPLVATARVTEDSGAPLTLPRFDDYAPSFAYHRPAR